MVVSGVGSRRAAGGAERYGRDSGAVGGGGAERSLVDEGRAP